MKDTGDLKGAGAASRSATVAPGGLLRLVWLLSVVLCLCGGASSFAADEPGTKASYPNVSFSKIRDGLELGRVRTSEHDAADAEFVILRIDPAFFEFSLHMATDDGPARTIGDWAAHLGLTAAINAGMYLPDKLTHTGLLRNATHTNNPRAGSKFGAFFVCQPREKNIPAVDMLERTDKLLQDKLKNYAQVVQNYRLIGSDGKILWKDDGPKYSTAAVAKDANGRILFILCQRAVSAAEFARCLQALPLSINLAMYVEGGSKAALFVNQPAPSIWSGRENVLGIEINQTLPNIIGVRPKK